MFVGHLGVFCQILGITRKNLDNYFNFENKLLFNNESILEINDYNNSSRGIASFTESCEIIRYCWVG